MGPSEALRKWSVATLVFTLAVGLSVSAVLVWNLVVAQNRLYDSQRESALRIMGDLKETIEEEIFLELDTLSLHEADANYRLEGYPFAVKLHHIQPDQVRSDLQEGAVASTIPISFGSKPLGKLVIEFHPKSSLLESAARVFLPAILAFALIFILGWLILRSFLHRRVFRPLVGTMAELERSSAIAKTTQLLAHDVRKPFSILKLLLDSLRMPMPEDEKAEFLKEGMQEVDSAIASVNGFLEDLMTVGATDSKLNLQSVSIRSLVEECLREQARVYPKAKIELKMDYAGVDQVYVDRAKILRVFSNIVINAIQAMKHCGRIEIRTENSENMTRVSISNFGSYIPDESLVQLFDTFFTSGKKGGTGLGLAIAKKWVEAHGGTISCSSQEGAKPEKSWVRFDFTIAQAPGASDDAPARRECLLTEFVPEVLKSSDADLRSSDLVDYIEALKLAKASAKRLGDLTVVVLEDEKPYADGLRRLYSQIFENSDSFSWASSPDDFAGMISRRRPDLVILDIDLKGESCDGLTVLRKHANDLNVATICVHSNRADSQTMSDSLNAGAHFVFPKPMTLSHFTKLTDSVADRRGFEDFKGKEKRKLRVAVIEDVLVFRRAWREKLRPDSDVSLFKRSSDFLKEAGPNEFDVVVTDFHLGEGEPTGAEVASALRKSGFSGPIVLASGVDDVEGELVEVFSAFASKTELMSSGKLRALCEKSVTPV